MMNIFKEHRNIFTLLPYEESMVFANYQQKIALLLLFKKILGLCVESINAFYLKKQTERFDPHIGESLCQIRAYSFILLARYKIPKKTIISVEKYKKKIGRLLEKIQSLTLHHHNSYNPILDIKETLNDFFNTHNLFFEIPEYVAYLFECYFLTIFRTFDAYGIPIGLDYENISKKLGISKTMAKNLVKDYQKKVAHFSYSFVSWLSERNASTKQNLSQINFLLAKKDDNGRWMIPCYLATAYILEHMIKHKQQTLVILKEIPTKEKIGGTYFIPFVGSPEKNDFTVLKDITKESTQKDWLIFHCVSAISSEALNAKEKILGIGLKSFVLANMAIHPQYSGERSFVENNNPFELLPKEIRNNVSLIEQNFLLNKKIAISNGYSINNPIALVCHIYYGTALKSTNKTFEHTDKIFLHPNNQFIRISEGIITMATQLSTKKKLTFLERIISMMPGHVYWKDRNGVFLGCNDLQALSAGLNDRDKIIGKTDFDMPWKHQAKDLQIIDKKVIETGQEIVVEELSELANGKKAVFLSKKTPLRDEHGEIIGILGTSFDITERKKLAEKLKTQVKKTEAALKTNIHFIAVASHEIRGPIANSISLLQLNKTLEKELEKKLNLIATEQDQTTRLKLAKEIRAISEKISKNSAISIDECFRAIDSLKNLGDLYQLKSERVNNSDTYFNSVSNLIETCIEPLKDNKKNISLNVEADKAYFSNIQINSKIETALKIIVNNAIRFSPPESSIIIKANISKKTQNSLVLSVEDKGSGMSEFQLKNLFNTILNDETNEKENRYTKPSIQLSIAKLCIESAGGEIKLESKENEGTIVSIEIPFEKSIHEYSPTEYEKNSIPIKENKKARMLLVEDDSLTLELEKTQLESLGHTVDTASNGKTAIKLLQENLYRIVFLDITLPDTNGLEIIKMAQDTINAETPYVAVTSHANQEDKDHFILEGMFSDVISKPITVEQFKYCIEAIEEALEGSDV